VLVGVNVVQIVFAAWLLPETRGLTLEEVQARHYSSRKRNEGVEEVEMASKNEVETRSKNEVDMG